jgi:hypothetical protein
MNNEQLAELKRRKLQLQEEIRLKALRDRIAPLINHAQQGNHPYRVYYQHENLSWIRHHIPVRKRDGYLGMYDDFQIDVDDASVVEQLEIREHELMSTRFQTLFASISPVPTSLIFCYEGGDPELEVPVEAFLSNPQVFFSKPETWVLSSDKSWIIEYIWDQGVIRFIHIGGPKPRLMMKIVIKA